MAEEHRALRLTPDEWMTPLFGESGEGGKRDILEGRLLSLALEALRIGTDVILDFGCWSRDERSAIRRLTESAGASCRLVYLPVDRATQRARITHRQASAPERTFPMSESDLGRRRARFEEPDAAEIAGRDIGGPPQGGRTGPRGPPLAGRPSPDPSFTRPPGRSRSRNTAGLPGPPASSTSAGQTRSGVFTSLGSRCADRELTAVRGQPRHGAGLLSVPRPARSAPWSTSGPDGPEVVRAAGASRRRHLPSGDQS